jgi:hypothetical protein
MFATLAAAQLTITQPSADIWWVAQSTNVMAWTCKTSPFTNFTVLIQIPNVPAPLQFLGIQQNFDCSITITNNQVNQAPGTGYQLLLANVFNNTDIFARSDPFEIKPLGSAYPSQVTPSPGASGSGTPSQSGANPSSSTGAALSMRHGASTLGALAAAVFAGFLGA